ncbi:NAD-dependent epimerase/dehydratase family protein [Intestinibacter bartlettii]|uniref:NAD-dependent epimerase/dehydratase family protein n=1 Tax=Intestinibacter bartlettii TaxID=261299 RepID=UPI0022E5E973|nr:NAD-dependent epimerase/dehydratase family protein [Intestinibacter bartlettii]
MSKILITGVAGFIGYHCAKKLLDCGMQIVGIDNLSDYYSIDLKKDRLSGLLKYEKFQFYKEDIINKDNIFSIFEKFNPNIVIHLAAQAGVRYSIENPNLYINTNIVGFYNVLDCCIKKNIEHLIFASSSSVYGNICNDCFSENDKADEPVSVYAATKKADEVLAYAIAKIYKIKITGLRFFTVYGPFGRPDMAYFSFANAIKKGKQIKLYNYGEVYRDYTYIDDVIEVIYKILNRKSEYNYDGVDFCIFNVANGKSYGVNRLIYFLEKYMTRKANICMIERQLGDVERTKADTNLLKEKIGYSACTDLEEGIRKFVKWYNNYYGEEK